MYTARPLDAKQRTIIAHFLRIPMKKTFKLVHPKIKVDRIVDSIKHDIKKYLKSERENSLPKGTKFWVFDCKLGQSEETATAVPQLELMSSIDEMVVNKAKTIYVEMTAKSVAALDGKV